MANRLLSNLNPFLILSRTYKKPPPGAVVYPGGIKYFPRFPDQVDPEVIPSKLFRVERLKRIKGTIPVVRNILEEFGIGFQGRGVTIVKNIPEVNARLWQIKHMVKITPVVFPYGEPTMADVCHTVLKENGECVVTKDISVPQERIDARAVRDNNPLRLTRDHIERDCRHKWMNPFNGGF